jgi:hypothetical protein
MDWIMYMKPWWMLNLLAMSLVSSPRVLPEQWQLRASICSKLCFVVGNDVGLVLAIELDHSVKASKDTPGTLSDRKLVESCL